MKKQFLRIVCAALTIFATASVAVAQFSIKIAKGEVASAVTQYKKTIPKKFFSKELGKRIRQANADPKELLAVQAASHSGQELNYSNSYGRNSRINTGYGMMPFCGSLWDSYFFSTDYKVEKNTLKDLIDWSDSKLVSQMYEYALPTVFFSFALKDDTGQAMTMLALWKAEMYLNAFDFQKEKLRSSKPDFTSTDWRGKKDYDAKLCAFLYRRISEGLSVSQASELVARTNGKLDGSRRAKDIFAKWKQRWLAGGLTSYQSWM